MAGLRRFLLRLINVFRFNRSEDDLAREVESHLALMEGEFRSKGMTADAARLAARRAFGGVELGKERHRDARSFLWFDDVRRDAVYALRTLRRTPGFTALAVLTLALGIGATTAIFSVCDALLLRPLPYPEADRLVSLRSVHASPTPDSGLVSSLDLGDWQTRARSFEAIAGYGWRTVDLTGGPYSERLFGLFATPEFFHVFGITQINGRTFTPRDRGIPAIVLGRDVWARRFAANPALVGSSLDINILNFSHTGATPHVVLGVVPTDVVFPPLTAEFNNGAVNGMRVSSVEGHVAFWLPAILPDASTRDTRWFDVVAKLRPGVTLAQAQADMDGVSRALAQEFPATNRNWTVRVVPVRTQIVGSTRSIVLLLWLATGVVLAIAVADVSMLLLARGIARQGETRVRLALGASRIRIARYVLLESLGITGVAVAVGVGLAALGLRLLTPFVPDGVPLIRHASISGPVLVFSVVVSLITAGGASLPPAWMSSGLAMRTTRTLRGSHAGTPHHRVMDALVVAQVALTMVLLISAGLLLKSAARLVKVDPGFTSRNVLTLTVSLPNNKFTWNYNAVFSRAVVAAVKTIPAVANAAVIQGVPMRPGGFWTTFTVEGEPPVEAADVPVAHLRVISPDYFRVMQIPVLDGRTLDERDNEGEVGHPRFVVVNQALAAHYWPGQSAVGRRLHAGQNMITIAGVVGDVRYAGLDTPSDFEIYLPEGLFPQAAITLLVKTAIEPSRLVDDIRARVIQVDREAFVMDVRTMDGLIGDSLSSRWLATLLLGVCAVVGLMLALAGIYGIVAQAVAQRRFEIGVRVALGSTPTRVVRLMLQRSIWPVALGAVGGLAGMTVVGRLLHATLFDTAPYDPGTFAAAMGLFMAVAFAATFWPARRAATVDPMSALRCE